MFQRLKKGRGKHPPENAPTSPSMFTISQCVCASDPRRHPSLPDTPVTLSPRTPLSFHGARNKMIAPSQNHEPIANRPEFKGPVKELLRLTENAVLLRSPDGCFYAHVSVGGRSETYPIRSAAFRDWLIAGYFRAWGELPSDWSLRRVRGKLEATARFDGGTPSIFVRVGHDGSGNRNGNGRAWYLDLCDPEGKAVKMARGLVCRRPPYPLSAPAGHLPHSIPTRDGSLDLLRPYVNLSDRDFRLLILWMTAALPPFGSRSTTTIRESWGHSSTPSPGACRNCRRSSSRDCPAWPTSPNSPRPSAASSGGRPGRLSQTITTTAAMRA